MNFRRRKRTIPELNTTSTADISFMLLIFFLVTTNMDVDKGLPRQLPPAEKQEQQESVVAQGTMMDLRISADNQLWLDGKTIAIHRLQSATEEFVRRVGKRHLIKMDVDPAAEYDTYFQVQNTLAAAYRTLRNDAAHRLYHRDYVHLTATERDRVKDECPQRIAEQYNSTSSTSPTYPVQKGGSR